MRKIEERTTAQVLSFAEFTTLVEHHKRALFAYLCGLVDYPDEAEELLHATFLDAWRAAQQGKPPLLRDAAESEQRLWLWQVASRRALSVLRQRRLLCACSQEATLATAPERMSSQGSFEDQSVEGAAIQAALAGLTPKEKTCLLLIVVQGFTAAEAAQILRDSPQAVAKCLARAKQRLLEISLAHER
jgi:RNA polymerase sigma-70 factor (ECF subfamily)